MRLRVTEEHDTFVYATSPVSFAGLAKEDLLFWMVPMALTQNIAGGALLPFSVGCFSLWLYKRLTAHQPEGYLILKLSVVMGELENSEFASNYPAVKTLAGALNRLSASVWLDKGLIPSHSYCNTYEP